MSTADRVVRVLLIASVIYILAMTGYRPPWPWQSHHETVGLAAGKVVVKAKG